MWSTCNVTRDFGQIIRAHMVYILCIFFMIIEEIKWCERILCGHTRAGLRYTTTAADTKIFRGDKVDLRGVEQQSRSESKGKVKELKWWSWRKHVKNLFPSWLPHVRIPFRQHDIRTVVWTKKKGKYGWIYGSMYFFLFMCMCSQM